MAAEPGRVSLWLEALEPGKPLSFLDHHIRVGNSLLGATPELIEAGLPDEALKPQQGDDRKICTAHRRRNKAERESGQRDVEDLMVAEPSAEYDTLGSRIRWIDESPDDTLGEVRGKEAQFRRLVVSGEYRRRQVVAARGARRSISRRGRGVTLLYRRTDSVTVRIIVQSHLGTISENREFLVARLPNTNILP